MAMVIRDRVTCPSESTHWALTRLCQVHLSAMRALSPEGFPQVL